VTVELLKTNFFRSLAPWLKTPGKGFNKSVSPDNIIALVRECCDYVHQHTKSLAANRIVASTLFRYAGIELYVRHKIAADFYALRRIVETSGTAEKLGWKLRWSESQADGYLMRLTQKDGLE
jgi:hypothetical protein